MVSGEVQMALQRWDDAERLLLHGCAMHPGHAGLHAALGRLYLQLQRFGDAMGPFESCVLLDPAAAAHRATLVAIYQTRAFTSPSERSTLAMTACLADPSLTHTLMHRAWLSLLRLDPGVADIRELLIAPDYASFCALVTSDRLAAWQSSEFVNGGLRRFLVADAVFERGLTFARRWFYENRDAADRFLPLLCTLARQCFLSEYAFACGEDVARLPDRPATAGEVALRACYRPLASHPDADTFLALSGEPSYRELVRMTVDEPRKEHALVPSIPTLSPPSDDVSRAVQAQYEENPYPRWTTVGGGPPAPAGLATLARGRNILVAGCGTGREAIDVALIFPAARVDAIDLSRASLAYASRKASEMRIENVHFQQADILDIARIGRSFDLIVSSGVLHHMRDPTAGLRALLGALRPRGALKIALYSTMARAAFTEARAWARSMGFSPTEEGIRAFRAAIFARDEDDPMRQRLTGSYDFYSISTCRDLAFHVEEHSFTLPDLADMVRELGLRVVQVEARGLGDMQAYRRRFPNDPAATSLANWHSLELESPTMFSRMYVLWLAREGQGTKNDLEWIRRTGRM